MCAFVSTSSFAKGECIGWVLFAEYRTVSFCALSPSLLDGCCSVSLLVSTSFAAAKLHHIAGQFLLPTGEHSRSCLASTCLWYLLSPFFFFCLSSSFCRQPVARLSQVWDDNVSKVTLPAWPGQGYGRYRLSSGLLVQFVSCPYSDVFDLLYDLDLCIVSLYLDSLESLL